MNANWTAGPDGDDGDFELMIVTSDDKKAVSQGAGGGVNKELQGIRHPLSILTPVSGSKK